MHKNDHLHPAFWLGIPSIQFFTNLDEVSQDPSARKNTNHCRRVYEKIRWDGMLARNGNPEVFFKEVAEPDLQNEAALHASLWNQGIANILVVSDPANVRIYSAFELPTKREILLDNKDERLIESMKLTEFVLRQKQFALDIQTGNYYRQHTNSFDPKKAINSVLLKNLKDARDQIIEHNDSERSPEAYAQTHTLLGKLLFICYLQDRGIISSDYFINAGAHEEVSLRDLFTKSSDKTSEIFHSLSYRLHEEFNGSLFNDEVNHRKISHETIKILGRFLSGENLASGQLSFAFAEYDFSLIPIETISVIYEDFLSIENQKNQHEHGVFYTPSHLAELTIDIATEGWESLLDKKFLDPSCGSGIFLVALFKRMAEEWRVRNPNAPIQIRAEELIKLLTSNLYGFDVSETACRISAFSLYLTFLDQFHSQEINALKNVLKARGTKLLPYLVADSKQHIQAPLKPINFFSSESAVVKDFDLVIGNPPWAGRNQRSDPIIQDWLFSADKNPYLESLTLSKSVWQKVFIPEKQKAHAFMWKAPLHAKAQHGRICFILPSKVWLNEHTNEFQRNFVKEYRLEQVWELADTRFVLFKNASTPACIVRYLPETPKEGDIFTYYAPKVARNAPQGAIVSVDNLDIKSLSISDLATAAKSNKATEFWKGNLWGSRGDLRFIQRLQRLSPLSNIVGKPVEGWPIEGPRWIKGQGFEPFRTNIERKKIGLKDIDESSLFLKSKPRWWGDDAQFINARSASCELFISFDSSDTYSIGSFPQYLRRSPHKQIFNAPMVLINQGFDRILFSNEDILFQDSFQSIKGTEKDTELLLFLTGVLNTPLSKYYLFHTSTNWGIERDKVHFNELLQMPFPLPEETRNPIRSQEIVKLVADRIKLAMQADLWNRPSEIKATKEDIYKWVCEYYNISEQEIILIEDTNNIFIPSSTPSTNDWQKKIPTLNIPSAEICLNYAKTLCNTLNKWLNKSKLKFKATSYIAQKLGYSVVILQPMLDNEDIYTENSDISTDIVFDLLGNIQEHIHNQKGSFVIRRGLIHFDKEYIYLYKPLTIRHWARSTALNDANEIFSALIGA